MTSWRRYAGLRKMHRADLSIIAVDVAEVPARVRRFLESAPVNFPVLLDADRAVTKAWGVSALADQLRSRSEPCEPAFSSKAMSTGLASDVRAALEVAHVEGSELERTEQLKWREASMKLNRRDLMKASAAAASFLVQCQALRLRKRRSLRCRDAWRTFQTRDAGSQSASRRRDARPGFRFRLQ